MTRVFAITIVAIVLMLSGAVILVAGDGGVIGFAAVAIGIALTALLLADKHRRAAPKSVGVNTDAYSDRPTGGTTRPPPLG